MIGSTCWAFSVAAGRSETRSYLSQKLHKDIYVRPDVLNLPALDNGKSLQSFTMVPLSNTEGDYGKSRKCASAASCGAARSAVARREVRPSDFSDRVAPWFRIISPNKPAEANCIGSFTAENGAGAEGEMGECSEGITASDGGRLSP